MLNAGVLAFDEFGRIRHTPAAPTVWVAGVPFAGPGLLCIDPSSDPVTHYHNGIGYQAERLGSVIGSVESYTQGGLGVNAGRVCVDEAAAIEHWNAGLPITGLGRLAIAAAPEESLYVNPQLAGGAESGPGGGAGSPPTAHTLGFNTVISRPMASDPEAWEINPTAISGGRGYLDYNCFTNNSGDIAVGDVVEVSAEFTTVYANVAIPLCMGIFNNSGITALTPTQEAPPVGQTARISVRFRVESTTWGARIRMGVGMTTVADMGVIVRKPQMWIVSGPPALGGFDDGFDRGFN